MHTNPTADVIDEGIASVAARRGIAGSTAAIDFTITMARMTGQVAPGQMSALYRTLADIMELPAGPGQAAAWNTLLPVALNAAYALDLSLSKPSTVN